MVLLSAKYYLFKKKFFFQFPLNIYNEHLIFANLNWNLLIFLEYIKCFYNFLFRSFQNSSFKRFSLFSFQLLVQSISSISLTMDSTVWLQQIADIILIEPPYPLLFRFSFFVADTSIQRDLISWGKKKSPKNIYYSFYSTSKLSLGKRN